VKKDDPSKDFPKHDSDTALFSVDLSKSSKTLLSKQQDASFDDSEKSISGLNMDHLTMRNQIQRSVPVKFKANMSHHRQQSTSTKSILGTFLTGACIE
jgi:hypothetical protein